MAMQRIAASYTRMPHYQVYYWMGLAAHLELSVAGAPWWYRFMPTPDLSNDIDALFEKMRAILRCELQWDARRVGEFVAGYRWTSGDRSITFAIDAHDGKEIFSPALLERCDIYFKANRWKQELYPKKVLPIVNGNGFLRLRHFKKLKSMRDLSRQNDFLFISRIWGGVEHNVRIFEALADLPCSKRLVAIIVKGAAEREETDAAIRRLQSVGVECTYDLLPTEELWRQSATSRIVMLRAGKYLCIPWRMVDLLCLGSCIVTDSDFKPQWPEPLRAGEHYVSAGIRRPPDTSAADLSEYKKLTATITSLLEDEACMHRIRQKGAEYFDNHAAPEQIGAYILERLEKFSQGGSLSI